MALDQKRKWTCDLCDKEVTVADGHPEHWVVDAKINCYYRQASADICNDCFHKVFPDYLDTPAPANVPKGEFKKPWWRRFFGLEEKDVSSN